MPYLDVRCPHHGVTEVYLQVVEGKYSCPECGADAERVWTNPASHTVEFQAGYDRMVWQHFDTKKQRDDYLRKENLTKVG